MAPLGKIVLKE